MKIPLSQIAFFTGVMALAITIPFTVKILTQTDRPLSIFSRATTGGTADLYLWPAVGNLSVCTDPALANCEKTKIQVILNTNGEKTGGGNIVIRYDPKVIKIVNDRIYPGLVDDNYNLVLSVFDYYRDAQVDSTNGVIKISARGNFTGEKGVAATFFVTGVSLGTAELDISSSTVLDTEGQNNLLGKSLNSSLTVK